MNPGFFHRITLTAMLFIAPLCLAQDAEEAPPVDYLALVRGYADGMIAHGRDTYGEQQSPLFAAYLDRETHQPREDREKFGWMKGYRNGDRICTGANVMETEDFYQMLYGLTEATGEAKYTSEADASLKWFFDHCQSEKGFLAWGEHMGWNFYIEAPAEPRPGKGIHEFARPWVMWDRAGQLSPQSVPRFAAALRDHQIGDLDKGLFSRHAHNPFSEGQSSRTGNEFPRHGGFYIAVWAAAYEQTGDEQWLVPIEKLTDSFDARRHPDTDFIPSQTSKPELTWPQSNLSLAIDLYNTAQVVPSPLSDKLLATAKRCDENFFKLPHDPYGDETGFVVAVITSTGEPGHILAQQTGNTKGGRHVPFTDTWGAGYGRGPHTRVAMICYLRYQQTKDERLAKLVVRCADGYLDTSAHDAEVAALYPTAHASAIAVQLAAYEITGDKKYLDRADFFGREAAALYFDDTSPLPKAGHPRYDFYDVISGAPALGMQMLRLWGMQQSPPKTFDMLCTDR